MENIFVLTEGGLISEYEELYDFLENVIDAEFLIENFDIAFDKVEVPFYGEIGLGTLLYKLGTLEDFVDNEIETYIEEIRYALEEDGDPYYRMGDFLISNKKENLMKGLM